MAVRESYSIKSDRERRSAPTFVKFSIFIYFWALIGFALGTLTLLGPVRWWATLCRNRGFSEGFESGGVVTLILVLVTMSFSLALWAATEWVRTPSLVFRIALPVVVLGLGYYAYSFWINPESMGSNRGAEQVVSTNFTFGPYPDLRRLKALHDEGYTAVISLLHPAVVPFEPQLIEREERDTATVGIEMIQLPMLPWVSDNGESLDRLRKIAERKEGRYYIHCYLGEDRVNVARRIVETTAGIESTTGTDTRKRIADKDDFERGEIYNLGDDVFLAPYPTDEEFSSYILGGQVGTVIALLQPKENGESTRIRTERDLLTKFAIDFKLVPIGSDTYDPAVIMDAVSLARSSKKPVVVHAFFPPSHKYGGVPQAFLQAFLSGKPPVPPHYFEDPLSNGRTRVVAPNVVTGPEPVGKEWDDLHEKGVRSAIFAGGGSQVNASSRIQAQGSGIDFNAEASVDAIVKTVRSGGPYYVYGPQMSSVADRVATAYGPAVPKAKRTGR